MTTRKESTGSTFDPKHRSRYLARTDASLPALLAPTNGDGMFLLPRLFCRQCLQESPLTSGAGGAPAR
ncbi:hypothetical protein ColLi_12004 [Colletotrichum liriopes]|uniref:Uncharacterized protein n=1 Tax=Colletotrichum liriopes TaxID=708192 RepID=A0AA37GZD9_9PEZI|nr:hypothetical protein ColLi_12004 [Colletotrichum liriopes]